MTHPSCAGLCAATLLCLSLATQAAETAPSTGGAKVLAEVIEAAVRNEAVSGAQLVVGTRHEVLLERSFGYASPDARRPVDADTRFGIGTGSEPLAAAAILAMADARELDLETPIDHWLPELARLRTGDGRRVERAPTLREILSHRAGFFAREGMTAEQSAMMRDYVVSLGQAVARIAHEPLRAEPGAEFASSNAGYLVAGRVAEVASGEAFEVLFRRTIGRPLGMKQSTFVPDADELVAVGREMVNGVAPHLTADPVRLALVGDGLYSTASDLGRFCQMVLGRGEVNQRVVLEEPTWRMYVSRSFEEQPYGFGWDVKRNEERMTQLLSHAGALSSYGSLMLIDLESAAFMAAVWTLAGAGEEDDDIQLAEELKTTWLAGMSPPAELRDAP